MTWDILTEVHCENNESNHIIVTPKSRPFLTGVTRIRHIVFDIKSTDGFKITFFCDSSHDYNKLLQCIKDVKMFNDYYNATIKFDGTSVLFSVSEFAFSDEVSISIPSEYMIVPLTFVVSVIDAIKNAPNIFNMW